MDLEILKPFPEYLIIDGGEFELYEFTLKIMTGVIKHFGSILELEDQTKLNVDGEIYGEAITKLAWLQMRVEDREFFPSYCIFKRRFLPYVKNPEKPTKEELEKLEEFKHNESIIKLVGKRSRPITKTEDKVNHLGKKIVKKKDKEIEPDYGETFIYVSTKISISLSEFYDLTIRQINKIVNELQKIEYDKAIKEARFHGIPIEDKKESMSFTKKEDDHLKSFSNNHFSNLMKGFKDEKSNPDRIQ